MHGYFLSCWPRARNETTPQINREGKVNYQITQPKEYKGGRKPKLAATMPSYKIADDPNDLMTNKWVILMNNIEIEVDGKGLHAHEGKRYEAYERQTKKTTVAYNRSEGLMEANLNLLPDVDSSTRATADKLRMHFEGAIVGAIRSIGHSQDRVSGGRNADSEIGGSDHMKELNLAAKALKSEPLYQLLLGAFGEGKDLKLISGGNDFYYTRAKKGLDVLEDFWGLTARGKSRVGTRT